MNPIDTYGDFKEKLESGMEGLKQLVLAARIHPAVQDGVLDRLDQMQSEILEDVGEELPDAGEQGL